jgi:hypothetical protein
MSESEKTHNICTEVDVTVNEKEDSFSDSHPDPLMNSLCDIFLQHKGEEKSVSSPENVKIPKRKMKSPQEVQESGSSNPPEFDQLFSKLFSSVLKGVGCTSEKKESVVLDNDNYKRDEESNTDSDNSKCDEESDTDSDNSKCDEESDTDSDNSECDHSECHELNNNDIKWNVLNKLLESHVNITRSIESLLRTSDE